MTKEKSKTEQPTIIKKYANRRLYDTGRSSYVTLKDLSEMVQENHEFVVKDAKSDKDITRSVLAQIIIDQESQNEGDGTLLSTNFMRKLIKFYGGNLQKFVSNYLESSIETFTQNQEQMQEQFSNPPEDTSVDNTTPTQDRVEEIKKQNITMIENTTKMFTDFGSDKK